jgi:hypothetical protein
MTTLRVQQAEAARSNCGIAGNLEHVKFVAEKCPIGPIGQQPAARLPWFHVVTLLTKVPLRSRSSFRRRGVSFDDALDHGDTTHIYSLPDQPFGAWAGFCFCGQIVGSFAQNSPDLKELLYVG